jgi:Xaa-Pro aminopeptidase
MIEPGATQREVGAHLAHRLLHHDLEPREVYVFSDDRTDSYARPRPTEQRIERSATLLASARHRGLYATASRTVSFGPPDGKLVERFQAASMVAGSCVRFSVPQETIGAVLKRAVRIYQKTGHEFAHHHSPQGCLVGCSPRGLYFQMDDASPLEPGMAASWTPMIEGVPCANTLLVVDAGNELLSYSDGWPAMGLVVKGSSIILPGILVR